MDSLVILYYLLCSLMLSFTLHYALVQHKQAPPQVGIFSQPRSTLWSVNAKLAWCTQEAPAFLISAYFLHSHWSSLSWQSSAALLFFVVHYFNRTCIYPWQLHSSKPIQLLYWIMAIVFCILNGTLQGITLTLPMHQHASPFKHPYVIITGLVLFIAGFLGNLHSDAVMEKLREHKFGAFNQTWTSRKESRFRMRHGFSEDLLDASVATPVAATAAAARKYPVPQRGLYRYVVAANYFCEAVEWWGYWLLSGCTLGAFSFALFTTVTLWSRAIHKHRRYMATDAEGMCLNGRQKQPFIPGIDFQRLIGIEL